MTTPVPAIEVTSALKIYRSACGLNNSMRLALRKKRIRSVDSEPGTCPTKEGITKMARCKENLHHHGYILRARGRNGRRAVIFFNQKSTWRDR